MIKMLNCVFNHMSAGDLDGIIGLTNQQTNFKASVFQIPSISFNIGILGSLIQNNCCNKQNG